ANARLREHSGRVGGLEQPHWAALPVITGPIEGSAGRPTPLDPLACPWGTGAPGDRPAANALGGCRAPLCLGTFASGQPVRLRVRPTGPPRAHRPGSRWAVGPGYGGGGGTGAARGGGGADAPAAAPPLRGVAFCGWTRPAAL